MVALRDFRKRSLVAKAEKPSSVGAVLGQIVKIRGGLSGEPAKRTSFSRRDVVSAVAEYHGLRRAVLRPVVRHRETRPANDIEWWRPWWRCAIGDLDDSTIDKLADDILAVGLAKHWITELKDGSTHGETLGFDDYYSTPRRMSPNSAPSQDSWQ
jgi:hypothetical protein